MHQLLLHVYRHGAFTLLLTWNWLSGAVSHLFGFTTRSVIGILDANREVTYVFYDANLPFVTRSGEWPGSPLCVYKPLTKTFVCPQGVSPLKHRFDVLSARLIGSAGLDIDLSEFFAEVSWTGSVEGPLLSHVIVAALLEMGIPVTSTRLATCRLEIEDEMGTQRTIVQFGVSGLAHGGLAHGGLVQAG